MDEREGRGDDGKRVKDVVQVLFPFFIPNIKVKKIAYPCTLTSWSTAAAASKRREPHEAR
jgi:hypothetical protein